VLIGKKGLLVGVFFVTCCYSVNLKLFLMSKIYTVIIALTSFLFLNSGFSQTIYISTSDGNYSNCLNWSPSCPPNLIPIGDSVIINHDIMLTADLKIAGSLTINSGKELSGNKSISVGLSGGIYNNGNLDIGQDLDNYGSFYNNGYAKFDKVINFGYICNTGTIEISPSKQFVNTGGTIDCGGELIVCKFVTQNNGGDIANVSNVNMCCNDGYDPNYLYLGGIVDSITVSFCGITLSGVNLPVVLWSFGLDIQEKSVLLNWVTKSELNNDYFVILRSDDGVNFEEIGELKGMGNSSITVDYQFIDDRPLMGTSYYKLQQVDFDGKTSFSEILRTNFVLNDGFSLYPNPTNSAINLLLSVDDATDIFIEIFDAQGKLVFVQNQVVLNRTNSVQLNTEFFNKGMYLCKVTFPNGSQMKQTFVKSE